MIEVEYAGVGAVAVGFYLKSEPKSRWTNTA
jgi:hypothetical protein